MQRILICISNPTTQARLQQLIQAHSEYMLCGLSTDGIDALGMVLTQKPDLVLVDLDLDGVNGLQVTRTLARYAPQVSIVALTNARTTQFADIALDLGARACIPRDAQGNRLLRVLAQVHPTDRTDDAEPQESRTIDRLVNATA